MPTLFWMAHDQKWKKALLCSRRCDQALQKKFENYARAESDDDVRGHRAKCASFEDKMSIIHWVKSKRSKSLQLVFEFLSKSVTRVGSTSVLQMEPWFRTWIVGSGILPNPFACSKFMSRSESEITSKASKSLLGFCFYMFLHVFTNFYFSVLSETRFYHIDMAPANSRSQPRWVEIWGGSLSTGRCVLIGEMNIQFATNVVLMCFFCAEGRWHISFNKHGRLGYALGYVTLSGTADMVNLGLLPWGPSPKRKNCLVATKSPRWESEAKARSTHCTCEKW